MSHLVVICIQATSYCIPCLECVHYIKLMSCQAAHRRILLLHLWTIQCLLFLYGELRSTRRQSLYILIVLCGYLTSASSC